MVVAAACTKEEEEEANAAKITAERRRRKEGEEGSTKAPAVVGRRRLERVLFVLMVGLTDLASPGSSLCSSSHMCRADINIGVCICIIKILFNKIKEGGEVPMMHYTRDSNLYSYWRQCGLDRLEFKTNSTM